MTTPPADKITAPAWAVQASTLLAAEALAAGMNRKDLIDRIVAGWSPAGRRAALHAQAAREISRPGVLS